MALPTSGPISWEMIRAEFGGGLPIHISQYYRGGGLVPDVAANANVPTSGAIGAWHFYGAVKAIPLSVSLSANTASGISFLPHDGSPATLRVISDSVIGSPAGGTGTYSYQWERVSGANITADRPTAAATTFSGTVPRNSTIEAVFRLRVQDGVSTVYSGDVAVDLSYYWNDV